MALLVLQAVAVAVLWWSMTSPTDSDGSAGDGSSTGARSGTAAGEPGSGSPAATDPPADLGDEEVWLADLGLQSGTLVLPDSTLTGVVATGQGVRSGPDGLVADRLELEGTVPFGEIAVELGGDSQVRAAADGQAQVVRTVELLGRSLTVEATGTVEVVDGLLVVEPQSIDLGGPDVLSRATASVVRRFVTIEHAIDGLPEGLVLLDVEVQDDGFRADLAGEDVVLVEGGAS